VKEENSGIPEANRALSVLRLTERVPMLIMDYFTGRSGLFSFFFGFGSLAVVAFLDYITGNEVLMVLFYLIPIASSSWLLKKSWAYMFSALSALTFIYIDLVNGHIFSSSYVAAWNGFAVLGVFLVISGILVALKESYLKERMLARVDIMTGIPNRKMFYEEIEKEAYRSKRYKRPMTVAYIDLDNFKKVNDLHGHETGDELLKFVGQGLKERLRVSDLAARLGGDEFVLLLPETDGKQAKRVINKLFRELKTGIQKRKWPVTLSVGVLSCDTPACMPTELIGRAVELMYRVKKSGKNGIRFGRM
jgi:diguanylate cyclase (GGDEF)-like protein